MIVISDRARTSWSRKWSTEASSSTMPCTSSRSASSSRVLEQCDGSLTKTADALGMHRNTLTRKMGEYKIKTRAERLAAAALPRPLSTRPLTLPATAHIISSRLRPSANRRPHCRDSTSSSTDGAHSMNVRPLHDRIIVQRIEEGEQKIGGIIIPDTAKEKPQQGKVIAAGNGKVEGRRQAHRRSTSRPATSSCSASTPARKSSSMARNTSSCAKTKSSASSKAATTKKKK